jgi:hypothetical protein
MAIKLLARQAAWLLLSGAGALQAQAPPPPDPVFAAGFEPDASSQIGTARAASDGPVSIRIEGATVTFVRTAEGNESAGFHLQDVAAGPALFVRVDPALTQPPIGAGDVVDLTVLAMSTVALRREAVAISDPVVLARGAPLESLVEAVDDAHDLASDVARYDAELVGATLHVMAAPMAGADGFLTAPVATRGVTADPRLVLRVPQSLGATLGLEAGCVVALDGVPIRQDGASAQWMPRSTASFTPQDCSGFDLVDAVATSGTSLRLRFNRIVAPATATTGSFSVSNGLAVVAAVANGHVVDLTTLAQAPGATYVLTVGGSIRDVSGAAIAGGQQSAAFLGY